MKKIYLAAAALFVAAGVSAQSFQQHELTTTIAKDIEFPEHSAAATDPTDTLGFDELGAQLIQYGAQSGYVFGTNDLFDAGLNQHQYNLEYARGFIANSAYTVIGAGFIFGSKEDVSGTPAAATAKLYNIHPNRALGSLTSPALTEDGPSTTVVASGDIAFADADTVFPNVTWVDFDAEGWVPGDFIISLDISALYGTPADTLVLLADEDGDSDGLSTWTRIAGSPTAPSELTFWVHSTMMLQGGLDVNLAIFAVVAESPNSIEEQGFLNGVKMKSYPNPALSSENITVQYGLESDVKNVEINVFDMNGKKMFTASLGSKAAGLYNLNIPAGTLSAGSYIYSIEGDGGRMAKRLEILK